jgi:hypothetical protein
MKSRMMRTAALRDPNEKNAEEVVEQEQDSPTGEDGSGDDDAGDDSEG